ncbi:MAG: BspA family leucine-rich repeat surface protein [Clostridia bacterium]|nr:BspA family leucine-rich repeat surface protein [Clostridia bacterium]
MKSYLRQNKAITLIALVITIIVLLILAGVTITSLTGENGLLQRASDAKIQTELAEIKDQLKLEVLGSYELDGKLSAAKVKENIENNVDGASVDGEDFDLYVSVKDYKFVIESSGEVLENGNNIKKDGLTKATLDSSAAHNLLSSTTNQEELMAMNKEAIDSLNEEQLGWIAIYLNSSNVPGAQVTKIEKFKGNSTQAQEKGTVVSTENSDKPIYMWFEQDVGKQAIYNLWFLGGLNINSGTLYWWSEADEIYFPSDCSRLFYDFQNIETLNGIREWKTDNVTRVNEMFDACMKLSNINAMYNWNTSNVTDMSEMFMDCGSLNNISALKNWDVSKVEDMSRMFSISTDRPVNKVPIVDGTAFKNWKTSSVKDVDGMFNYCSELSVLDLSNFDTSKIESCGEFFNNCNKLGKIIVGNNWDATVFTSNGYSMFSNCYALVGEQGTTYNDDDLYETEDYTYAHIDGGQSNPGYLSSH